MSLPEQIDDPLSPRFDYEQLDSAAASKARAAVEQYRSRVKAYVIDTGRDLLSIKEHLDHGLFLQWVGSEMGLTPRTAQNFMQAAARLGHKSEIVSHLPPVTLYQLASPSTPDQVRSEIVSRLEAGEQIAARDIRHQLIEARSAAKQEAAEAKLTAEARKKRAQAKRNAAARRDRATKRWREEQEETTARQEFATRELATLLAERLDRETFKAAYDLLSRCNPWKLREALAAAYGSAERAA